MLLLNCPSVVVRRVHTTLTLWSWALGHDWKNWGRKYKGPKWVSSTWWLGSPLQIRMRPRGRSFGFPRRADGSGLVDFKYGILLIPYFELTSVDLLVLMFELEGVVDWWTLTDSVFFYIVIPLKLLRLAYPLDSVRKTTFIASQQTSSKRKKQQRATVQYKV